MGTKTEAIAFRAMEAKDLEAVACLEQEAFPDAWNTKMLQDELENSLTTYIVMEKDQQLVGYAGFWLVAGEAQITRVAVQLAQRGQGLGNALTAALLSKAWELGAEAVTLEVREHNVAAQKAYLRNGFVSHGVRPHYYEDTHEGAVIMWVYKK